MALVTLYGDCLFSSINFHIHKKVNVKIIIKSIYNKLKKTFTSSIKNTSKTISKTAKTSVLLIVNVNSNFKIIF